MVRAVVLSEQPERRPHHRSPEQYGIDALVERGWRLTGARVGQGPWATKARDVVEHRSGMKVEQPLRAMAAVRRADLVIALLEQFARLPSALRRRGRTPYAHVPLVMLECWLAERLLRADPVDRVQMVRAYDGVDLVVAWSRNQIDVLQEAGFESDRVASIPFGVDDHMFDPSDEVDRDLDLVAVGQDAGRDYGTLFSALGRDLTATVVCRPANLVGLAVPPGVTVIQGLDRRAYARLLRRAKVVVVPTRELAYPTGQTVALEAAAAGAAVVVSNATPMREYFEDRVTAVMPAVGDVGSMREALHELLVDDAMRARIASAATARVREDFTEAAMWSHFADLVVERGLVRESAVQGPTAGFRRVLGDD